MGNLVESLWVGKRPGVILGGLVHAILITVLNTIFLSSCRSTPESFTNIKPGDTAPDLNLKAARGNVYDLASFRKQTILLSFINTQAKATTGESDPSRAQIVFLKSMQEQYGAKGLN